MSNFIHHISNNDLFKTELPIKIKLSFAELVNFWEQKLESENSFENYKAKEIMSLVKAYPKIREPFENINETEKYEEVIRLLTDDLFPIALTNNEIKAIQVPFQPYFIRPTLRLQNIISNLPEQYHLFDHLPEKNVFYGISCIYIMNMRFRLGYDMRKSFYLEFPNKKTGFTHYLQLLTNGEFAKVLDNENSHKVQVKNLNQLPEHFMDVDAWKKLIPPNSFDFVGFAICNLFDSTVEYCSQHINADLLRKNALQNKEILGNISKNLQNVLNVKDLNIGFMIFKQSENNFFCLEENRQTCILLNDDKKQSARQLLGESKFENLVAKHTSIWISKETSETEPTKQYLKEKGIGSYLAFPLVYDGKLIGLLEISGKSESAFTQVSIERVLEFLPTFTISLQRAIEEHQNKIELVIQEKCTNIHPALKWKFQDAAMNYLSTEQNDFVQEMEEIVFEDVHPLFGQFDIKGSSTARNASIAADLVEQCNLACMVFEQINAVMDMPIYEAIEWKLIEYREKLKTGLNTGDETELIDFLRTKIHPIFNYLKESNENLNKIIEAYTLRLDHKMQTIYHRRRQYENSVNSINETIAKILDDQQIKMQKIFPHYFEKYKTDGIEYNIYIGKSLQKKKKFAPLYLFNIRLWQLMLACEVEFEMQKLKKQSDFPLDICSLIFVHDEKMSIRFRYDEKQFDADGVYNIRYEIIKKRIDKSVVKGTGERLTQPGKISIIYSQNKEANEYRGYINYLLQRSLILPDIEWLELEELKGASGLKAIRLAMNFDWKESDVKKISAEFLDNEIGPDFPVNQEDFSLKEAFRIE